MFLLASADIRNWFFSPLRPALDWTNQRNNAGAVQAFIAILQAVGTLFLLVLTWHAIDSSRRIADRARDQAKGEAARARDHELQAMAHSQRQATIATLPVVAFLDPKNVKGLYQEITFRLVNVGMGPAIFTQLELSDSEITFQLDRLGETLTLRPSEEVVITLTLTDFEETRAVIFPPERNEHGQIPLAVITARSYVVRGNRWESKALLVFGQGLRFSQASFTQPD